MSASCFVESVKLVAPHLTMLILDAQPASTESNSLARGDTMIFGTHIPYCDLRSTSDAILPHCTRLRVLHLADEKATSSAFRDASLVEELVITHTAEYLTPASPLYAFISGDPLSLPALRSLELVRGKVPILKDDIAIIKPACEKRKVHVTFRSAGRDYGRSALSRFREELPDARNLG